MSSIMTRAYNRRTMTESPCPAAETLEAYVAGRVDDGDLAAIANHLLACENCYANVAARARSLSSSWEHANVAPSLALLPALATGTVIAIALTVCLLLLNQPS